MSNPDNGNSGRTLGGSSGGGGGGERLPSSWSRPTNSAPRIGRIGNWSGANNSTRNTGGARIASLRDMASSEASPREDSSDGDDDRAEGETWFTGGERSGLSVQNPEGAPGSANDLLKRLLKKAEETGRSASPSPSSSGPSHSFRGSGMTLGGEGTESRVVEDTNRSDEEEDIVVRRVTVWRNGFTIEDGPLRSLEDPASFALLQQIMMGNAPPQVLNVGFGQRVDLKIDKHSNEDYVPPKAVQTFSGGGQRLGAPSAFETAAPGSSMPGSFQEASSGGGDAAMSEPERNLNDTRPIFEVSDGPRTRITIRFADGTREIVTMNLTHTIADIRNFMNFSRRESNSRPYMIVSASTRPPRELTDETQTIADAKLEKSVVMQKWN